MYSNVDKKTGIELTILAAILAGGYFVIKNASSIASGAVDYLFPSVGEPYADLIRSSASQYGIPWQLLAAQLQKESYFNPNAYNTSSRASGIAQFEPATAQELGIEPFNPNQAIPAQAKYMSVMRTQVASWGGPDSWAYALAAYNWGIGHVQRAIASGLPPSQWPAETRNYVLDITKWSGVDTATAQVFA